MILFLDHLLESFLTEHMRPRSMDFREYEYDPIMELFMIFEIFL